MNLRLKITLYVLLIVAICDVGFGQVVEMPDSNLRRAVMEALNLPAGAPITQADMLKLTHLGAERQGIEDLTGLEHATHLRRLVLHGNRIDNLAPLATLTQLEVLGMLGNLIQDISPLKPLSRLQRVFLNGNLIADITPLANLTQLQHLSLEHNFVADVRPLAGLHNLVWLQIHNNQITDHSPLDALSLHHFTYDQSCYVPPEPVLPRLANRLFPSIINTGRIVNNPALTREQNVAQHDLWFCCLEMFDQHFVSINNQWHVRGDLAIAQEIRDRYSTLNPNLLFFTEIKWRDTGDLDAFPDNHPYWLRKPNGEIAGDSHSRLINYAHPVVQDIIVGQALAVARCGLYDGIVFDWWDDFRSSVGDYIPNELAQRARDNILARIRATTHPDFLIMVNTNDRIIPRTGPQINGGIMESTVPQSKTGQFLEDSLIKVENSLRWLDRNLRQPRINALQGGSIPDQLPDSHANLRWMRAITTLSLTHSDGYVVFAIGSDNNHYWYDFWDADLGRPVGPKAQLYDEDIPGLYIREFTNGWAVYNHSGDAQVITLPEEVQGVASGLVNTEHALPNLDGEMYLRMKPKNPADVNGDGVVNILDLTIIARGLGTDSLEADVNGDGLVNILDLVFVANAF